MKDNIRLQVEHHPKKDKSQICGMSKRRLGTHEKIIKQIFEKNVHNVVKRHFSS